MRLDFGAMGVQLLPVVASDVEAAMIIYVAAGLPAWWVLGFIFKWLHTRQDKDAAEIIRELRP